MAANAAAAAQAEESLKLAAKTEREEMEAKLAALQAQSTKQATTLKDLERQVKDATKKRVAAESLATRNAGKLAHQIAINQNLTHMVQVITGEREAAVNSKVRGRAKCPHSCASLQHNCCLVCVCVTNVGMQVPQQCSQCTTCPLCAAVQQYSTSSVFNACTKHFLCHFGHPVSSPANCAHGHNSLPCCSVLDCLARQKLRKT
jgi:hypothetical protein